MGPTLAKSFPIQFDDLRLHYNMDPSSPDKGSLLPAGWHLLASDQPNWKQLRDETVTLMISNLQLDLHDKRHEIKQSLEILQAAGYMSNVSLTLVEGDELVLPVAEVDQSHDVDGLNWNENQDPFVVDPQIAHEDAAVQSLPILPNVVPAGGTWFERSFANLMGCVIVLDLDDN